MLSLDVTSTLTICLWFLLRLVPYQPTSANPSEWPLLCTSATARRVRAWSSQSNNDKQSRGEQNTLDCLSTRTQLQIFDGAALARPTAWEDILLSLVLATQDIRLCRRPPTQRVSLGVALHSHTKLECFRHIYSHRRCRPHIADMEPREDECQELNRAAHARRTSFHATRTRRLPPNQRE
jgi:hypothetical protein